MRKTTTTIVGIGMLTISIGVLGTILFSDGCSTDSTKCQVEMVIEAINDFRNASSSLLVSELKRNQVNGREARILAKIGTVGLYHGVASVTKAPNEDSFRLFVEFCTDAYEKHQNFDRTHLKHLDLKKEDNLSLSRFSDCETYSVVAAFGLPDCIDSTDSDVFVFRYVVDSTHEIRIDISDGRVSSAVVMIIY